jgi:hypothetical protein
VKLVFMFRDHSPRAAARRYIDCQIDQLDGYEESFACYLWPSLSRF